ncbi:MAG: ABC transporter ATP-binding protein, partial [bacterium]|nr:ABC transporter ATP-binding protein [bacterium]
MAELSLRKVTKQFGAVTALSDIDLEIAHREFVVIVGPSGCGKSTLLRVIAGLEQLTTGEIYVGGEAVHRTPAAKRGLAMVFQNYALYPHKTVAQNMGFALRMAKTPKSEIDSRVNQAARILQIEDLLER